MYAPLADIPVIIHYVYTRTIAAVPVCTSFTVRVGFTRHIARSSQKPLQFNMWNNIIYFVYVWTRPAGPTMIPPIDLLAH